MLWHQSSEEFLKAGLPCYPVFGELALPRESFTTHSTERHETIADSKFCQLLSTTKIGEELRCGIERSQASGATMQ